MSELDELVAAARSLDEAPPPGAEPRMWAAIAGAPAIAPTAAATGASGAAAATAGKTGGSLLLKIMLGVTVIGGGTAAAVVSRTPDPSTDNAIEPAPTEPSARAERPAPDPTPPPTPVEPNQVEPEPQATPPRTRRTAPPKSRPNLADETKLLRQAKVALSQGRAGSARKRLAEHKRRFPTGELIELRMALEVSTLCALDRDSQADAVASRFLKKFPSSALATKVRQRCAD